MWNLFILSYSLTLLPFTLNMTYICSNSFPCEINEYRLRLYNQSHREGWKEWMTPDPRPQKQQILIFSYQTVSAIFALSQLVKFYLRERLIWIGPTSSKDHLNNSKISLCGVDYISGQAHTLCYAHEACIGPVWYRRVKKSEISTS